MIRASRPTSAPLDPTTWLRLPPCRAARAPRSPRGQLAGDCRTPQGGWPRSDDSGRLAPIRGVPEDRLHEEVRRRPPPMVRRDRTPPSARSASEERSDGPRCSGHRDVRSATARTVAGSGAEPARRPSRGDAEHHDPAPRRRRGATQAVLDALDQRGVSDAVLGGACVYGHLALGVAAAAPGRARGLLLAQPPTWEAGRRWGRDVLDPDGQLATPWEGQAY